jgi:hypothetical protein
MSSLGEIAVIIRAVNEATPEFEAVTSDAASMASAVSGSSMTLHVENLASPEIAVVAEDAARVKAQVEASPITISFSPIDVPSIPPIEVPSIPPIEVPPVDTSPIQTSLNEVGVSATEMGDNVRASALSFDEMGTHAEATTVKLTTVARGISSVSSLGLGLTTLAGDFGLVDSETAKYMRTILAVVTVVSSLARVISYSSLLTTGHTATVALDTTTETASTGASIASTVATNIKTAATWIATTAQNALNISHATFLALTGVGIAVIIAAAAAIAYFASQMNAATESVKGYNAAAAETPARTQGITRAGEQAMYRHGVE